MSCDFLSLAKPGVQSLQPYQPGKPIEDLQRELGLQHIVKLASNENPLGLSPKVKALLENSLDQLTRYPDGAGFVLKQALANKHGVRAEQITLGNGSNDVLNLIGLCFLNETVSAVYSQHAFIVYSIMVNYLESTAIEVPAKDFGHDLQAMLAAVTDTTRLVFIANPNNPTGSWLRHDELRHFLSHIADDVIVVLDEAYAEYIQQPDYANGLLLLQDFPNLIITRTFSKAYGLAGLRVGYSISSSDIADLLNRLREPFNVNTLAQLAAVEVLSDDDYLTHSIQLNNAGRLQLQQGFDALGLSYIPSQGNFVTFDTQGDALAIYQQLLEQGVIVRPIAVYGLPRHLRVSIGLQDENATFLAALECVMKSHKTGSSL